MMAREEVASLVRLHSFLLHARALADDDSAPGRHGALVSLDGVCEYAMLLAAHSHGVKIRERASFVDSLNALASGLGGWRQEGRRGVIQMHGARNQAQHAGALPDPEHMAEWSYAADTFVHGLVKVAFGVVLSEVMLGDAIVDGQLRGWVSAAERALDRDDAPGAFASAMSAMLEARHRWRDQQADAYQYMPTGWSSEDDPLWLESSQRAEDYADVGVFASDLGEYHWLLATRRQQSEGLPLSVADARRALLFTYHWILRWQRFDAAYPRERWRAHWQSVRPPVLDGCPSPAIIAADVRGLVQIGDRQRQKIVLRVANVPEDGRGTWATDAAGLLAAVLSERELSEACVEAGMQEPWLGELTFFADPAVSPQLVSEIIVSTLTSATEAYDSRRFEVRERAQEALAVEGRFVEIFEEMASDLFGDVRVEHDLRFDGEVLVVSVSFLGSSEEIGHAAQIFSGGGGVLANTSIANGSWLSFVNFEPDAAARITLLSAITRVVEQVEHLRDNANRLERERQRYELGLRQTLVAP